MATANIKDDALQANDTNAVTLASPGGESAPLPPKQDAITSLLPLILVFLILYLLVIRPQHKKLKTHNQLINSLKKGDKVVTSGGIMGTITNINDADKTVEVEIADKVVVKLLRTSITDLSKSNAKTEKKDSAEKNTLADKASKNKLNNKNKKNKN